MIQLSAALIALLAIEGTSTGQRPGGPRRVELNLAEVPPGTEVRLAPMAGETLEIVAINLAPAARYQVTVEWPGRAPQVHHKRTEPLPRPSAFDQCRTMEATLASLFSATSETEAARHQARLEADLECRTGTGTNPGWQDLLRAAARGASTWSLGHLAVFKADEVRRLVVTREAANDVPQASWTVVAALEVPTLEWRYPTEEAWVIDEILRDIVETVAFSRGIPPSPELVSVVGQGQGHQASFGKGAKAGPGSTIGVTRLWSPDDLVPAVRAALRAFDARPLGRVAEAGAHSPLTDLRAPVIRRVARRFSDALRINPLDPLLNESAAFIVGALAWREARGELSDVRPALNRMAAHLTLARAVRPEGEEASTDGQLASAMLDVLAGRQRAAVDAVQTLVAARGPSAAWARAITARATGDWRPLQHATSLTLVERLALVRELAWHLSGQVALSAIDSDASRLMDWGYLSLTAEPTVQETNLFGPTLVPATLVEATEMASALLAQPVETGDGLILRMDVPSSRLIGPHGPDILPWSAWARFYERHLLLGATIVRAGADGWDLLAPLSLFPLVAPARPAPSQPEARADLDVAQCRARTELVRTHPERVTEELWSRSRNMCARERDQGLLPPLTAWMSPPVPTGTAYRALPRLFASAREGLADAPRYAFETLHALAPWDQLPPRWGAPSSADDYATAYGEMLAYSLPLLLTIAQQHPAGSADQVQAYLRMCDLVTDYCAHAADVLEGKERDAERMALLERVLDGARDRVLFSNSMIPLVDHYLDRGDAERAIAVAGRAAEVGSHVGLSTLSRALQRTGRFEEAEAVLQQIASSYGDRSGLQVMHIRANRPQAGDAFARKSREAVAALFPMGVERVTLVDFSGPPADGVLVSERSRLQPAGLRPGDVIVAVDGIRVRNANQHDAARAMKDAAAVSFIAWREGRYFETTGTFANRFYPAYFSDYRPQGAAPR